MKVLEVILSIFIILLIACGVFFLVAFICATVNNVSLINQLKDWFGSVNKETVESMASILLNFKK